MINLIKQILLSVSIVSIFSTIILNIVGKDNPEYEIAKISCGLLMIIAIISPFKGNLIMSTSNFTDIYDFYKQQSMLAYESFDNLQKRAIKENIEQLIYNDLGYTCSIELDDDFNILKISSFDKVDVSEICKLLGISTQNFEYIESR